METGAVAMAIADGPRVRRRAARFARRPRVDDHEVLGEARARAEDARIGSDHARPAVEDEVVLPAHGVHARDDRTRFARAAGEHLAVDAVLAGDERTRARDREDGRPLPRGVRDRIAFVAARAARVVGLPEVLAEEGRHALARMREDEARIAGREVAVLVEDVVARKELLAGVRLDASAAKEGERIRERPPLGGDREAHEDGERRRHRRRKTRRRRKAGVDDAAAPDEVARRIAEERHLGEDREIGPLARGARDRLGMGRLVAAEIADDRILLDEGDLQRGSSVGRAG